MPAPVEARPNHHESPPRILVVEDERIVAMNLQMKLEQMGYEVPAVVSSAENAVRAADEAHPNLVLMDINLEGPMDGVAAAQAIRERHAIPVVYLTAYSTRDVVERAKLTEPHGYILKPFVDRELQVVIEMALYRHRAERQLAQQRQLLSATLKSIGDAVVATDADGRVTFMNPAAEELTGWPGGEARGRPVEEVLVIVAEADRRPVPSPLRRAMAEKVVVPLEHHMAVLTRDKRLVPVDDSAAPILDADGRLLGGVLIFQNATIKREAARAASNLAAIVASSQDAVIGFNASGLVTSWNPAAERLFGYSAPEAIGQTIFLFAPPEAKEEVRSLAERIWLGEVVPPYAATRLRKDGTPVQVNIALSAVKDAEGHLTGFAAIVRDMSPVRELEAQLRQAQKMEAFGQLAGGVAHDFNNLLTVINGYSALLLEALPDDDARRGQVVEIREAGDRAARLTRQLLAFSRRQVLEPVVLDLNEVVGNTAKMLRRIIGEDIQVVTNFGPDLRPIKADIGQVEQLLLNLAVNARDAMPGGGRLTFETSNVAPGMTISRFPVTGQERRAFVRLKVTDTGCGMSEEVQARIFEPFFTTKELGKGTGLGLAMAYGFVRQSGGLIDVASTVGAGTTFTILFPLADAGAASSPSRPEPHFPRSPASEVVLLVEDEPAVRSVIRTVLRMQGYKVLDAAGGPEALALAETHADPIDILVTDVVMPEMGGRQLADALRQRRPGLKLLYLSGYMDDEVVRHGIATGADNFLQKPFSPLRLAAKVRNVLDNAP